MDQSTQISCSTRGFHGPLEQATEDVFFLFVNIATHIAMFYFQQSTKAKGWHIPQTAAITHQKLYCFSCSLCWRRARNHLRTQQKSYRLLLTTLLLPRQALHNLIISLLPSLSEVSNTFPALLSTLFPCFRPLPQAASDQSATPLHQKPYANQQYQTRDDTCKGVQQMRERC